MQTSFNFKMPRAETFNGYINTLEEAVMLAQACDLYIVPCVKNRLTERERRQITCGSIFVFCEEESGIKRWTDGKAWSPSRIFGNFLIYKVL